MKQDLYIQFEIKDKIIEFLSTKNLRNQWLVGRNFKIYVRKSKRILNYQQWNCFDLASIELTKKFRGKGIMTAIICWLTKELIKQGFNAIFVESVLDERFGEHLKKLGAILFSNYPQSYFFKL